MKGNTEKSIQYSFPTNSCFVENLFTIVLEVKSRLSYNHKMDTRQTSRKLKWISFIHRKLASPHIRRGKLFVHQDKIHSCVCGQRSLVLFCYLQFTVHREVKNSKIQRHRIGKPEKGWQIMSNFPAKPPVSFLIHVKVFHNFSHQKQQNTKYPNSSHLLCFRKLYSLWCVCVFWVTIKYISYHGPWSVLCESHCVCVCVCVYIATPWTI